MLFGLFITMLMVSFNHPVEAMLFKSGSKARANLSKSSIQPMRMIQPIEFSELTQQVTETSGVEIEVSPRQQHFNKEIFYQRKVDELSALVEKSEQENAILKEEIEMLNARLESAEMQHKIQTDQLMTENKNLKGRIIQFEQKVVSLKTQKDRLNGLEASLNRRIKSLELEKISFIKLNDRLVEDMAEMSNDHESKIQELTDSHNLCVKDFEAKLEKVQSKLTVSKQENETCMALTLSLQQDLKSSLLTAEALRSRLVKVTSAGYMARYEAKIQRRHGKKGNRVDRHRAKL